MTSTNPRSEPGGHTATAAAPNPLATAELLSASTRARRQHLGLTLEQVSQASGLSKSFLSQIESGSANPTLDSVSLLASALQCSLPELLGAVVGRREPYDPVLRRARPLQAWPEGEGRTYPLSPVDAQLLRVHLNDGQPDGHDWISEHPGDEFALVIEGSYDVEVAGHTYSLTAGDSLHYRSDDPHRIYPTSEPARMVAAYSPARDTA
jgi:transcriptional regulator with XRE-family HTH domain